MKARRFTAWLCALLLAAALFAPAAGAAGQATPYVSTVYNDKNGLPTSEANAVLQTADGYLWVGSYGGLIRYDGSTFRNFSREGALPTSSIRSLFEDSAGRLWIGSNDAGIYVYENGCFTAVPCTVEHTFLCIRDFAEGPDGTIYAASSSGVGIIRDGALHPYTDVRVAEQPVYSLGVDCFGRLWCVMNHGGCAVLRDDSVTAIVPSEKLLGNDEEIYCITSDRQGCLYFGTAGTVLAKVSFSSEGIDSAHMEVTRFQAPQTVTHNRLRVTEDGDVLVCGLRGFALLTPDGTLHEFAENEHASGLNDAAVDYEGNIWLASSNEGLIRCNRGCFTTPGAHAGLTDIAVNAVVPLNEQFYIATDQGVLAFDQAWNPIENCLTALLAGIRVRCAIGDRAGRLWCATYSDYGAVCYDPADDTIKTFHTGNGLGSNRVRTLLELSDGSIAAGTQDGLAIIRDGAVARTYGKGDGLETLIILCLAEAPDGTLLAGSDGSGIYAIRPDGVTRHSFHEGLNEGTVLRILPEPDGSAFVSAGSSLYLWENGTFRRLDNFDKDAGSIFDLYDRDGRLWLLQNGGVLCVNKAELIAGEAARTVCYGANHGLSGSLNANTWNALTPDGQLYISTRSGISIFGFHGVESHLPLVHISSVRADDAIYEHPDKLTLGSGTQRITVNFAALSFSGTSSLRVAYYLEGFDENEIVLDDGLSGSISYTNLPGGDYTFHVRVYDPEHPDSENFCRITIYKELHPYERPLFWILLFAGLILATSGILLVYYRIKLRRLHERQQEYQQIAQQSLHVFAKAIDAKDPYTNGHSHRVAWYSREIARRMGLSEAEQERIGYIAMLHDIGKIGIPDHILNKNGPLTAEERRIIQNHPAIGGDILKSFTALKDISDGARYHHERYDGSGYCTGKAGEEIPLVARIIGVADSYDAMSSDRCYRKALSPDMVADELSKGAGVQFDPKIVPIMLDMIADGTAPVTFRSGPTPHEAE